MRTFGVEHELGDWDQRRLHELGPGFKMDRNDITCMNSNGIAADPLGKRYPFGGEINTPPTETIQWQVRQLGMIRMAFPNATVNHRSNLHIHIRDHRLIDNLDNLKKVADYGFRWLPVLLDFVEPIPRPDISEYPLPGHFEGAMRRYRRRLVSHHTIITPKRYVAQQQAKTLQEFFEAEAPKNSKGQPLWHLAPRHAVNLRHLREDTQTIEFRHFPGTLNYRELECCLLWCSNYLDAALEGIDGYELMRRHRFSNFPKFPKYNHELELIYRATLPGEPGNTAESIAATIERIHPCSTY